MVTKEEIMMSLKSLDNKKFKQQYVQHTRNIDIAVQIVENPEEKYFKVERNRTKNIYEILKTSHRIEGGLKAFIKRWDDSPTSKRLAAEILSQKVGLYVTEKTIDTLMKEFH